MKRILEEFFFSLVIFSTCWKYWSIRGCIQQSNIKSDCNKVNDCIKCYTENRKIYYTHNLMGNWLANGSIPHKYKWCRTLAFSKSRSFPIVENNRQRHSKLSSSWFFKSLTTQSCMMGSVSIFSLKSSPMNLMFPSDRLRALFLASSSSSFRRWRSSS